MNFQNIPAENFTKHHHHHHHKHHKHHSHHSSEKKKEENFNNLNNPNMNQNLNLQNLPDNNPNNFNNFSKSKSESYSKSRSKSNSLSKKKSPYSYSRSRSKSGSKSPKRFSKSKSKSFEKPYISQRYEKFNPELVNVVPSKCVGVFGLSPDTNEQDLINSFSKFSKILKATVVFDKQTQQSKNFGFLYFDSLEEATKAKQQGNNIIIKGKSIRTDFSVTEKPHSATPGTYLGNKLKVFRGGRGGFFGRGGGGFRGGRGFGRGGFFGRGGGGFRGGRGFGRGGFRGYNFENGNEYQRPPYQMNQNFSMNPNPNNNNNNNGNFNQ